MALNWKTVNPRYLAGHTIALSSYRGHEVVLIDFWATWCGPCRRAMPDLQILADRFAGCGLEILSVNQGESADQVREFIKRQKYTFRVALDQNLAVGSEYGVQAIPTLVLLDKNGVVRSLRVGYSDDKDILRRLVERLIKE